MDELHDVAKRFGVDSERLQRGLDRILDKYQASLKTKFPKPSEIQGSLSSIKTLSERLRRETHALPPMVRDKLDMTSIEEVFDDPNDGEIPLVYGKGFLADLESRLSSLSAAAGSLQVRKPQKAKMYEKNILLRELRWCWEDLTGDPPTQSDAPNSFVAFIECACRLIEVDSTGLAKRHKKFQVK